MPDETTSIKIREDVTIRKFDGEVADGILVEQIDVTYIDNVLVGMTTRTYEDGRVTSTTTVQGSEVPADVADKAAGARSGAN